MNIVAEYPRFMSPDLAETYVGGLVVLESLERQGLLQKLECGAVTFYDRRDLDSACDRFVSLDIEGAALPPLQLMEKNKPRRLRRYQVRPKLRLFVLSRDGDLCHYCGAPANSVDHVLAHTAGGQDEAGNLVAACMDCNRRKHAKSYEEFTSK